MRGIGDNHGPRLDDEDQIRPMLAVAANCGRCRHWRPPPERDRDDYRAFQNGAIKRRIAEPRGACDRVRLRPTGPTSFSATVERSRCYNFEPKEAPARATRVRGFVTIYENGRIAWQGTEGDEPAQYRQQELDL